MRYSFREVILEGPCLGRASARTLLGLGWLLGQEAALPKHVRELAGVILPQPASLGACKKAGQKTCFYKL